MNSNEIFATFASLINSTHEDRATSEFMLNPSNQNFIKKIITTLETLISEASEIKDDESLNSLINTLVKPMLEDLKSDYSIEINEYLNYCE